MDRRNSFEGRDDPTTSNRPRVCPPNNFRTLSVYPTCEEILSPGPAFVRRNIIKGRYTNANHYLDVQFRLMKEDFLGPLRQGIAEYMEHMRGDKKSMKFYNVIIHPSVVLRSTIFENDRIGVILIFPDKKASDQIFTPYSKRCKYGSLVCLTNNNFNSIFFGKIIERDNHQKRLIISFDPNSAIELNVMYTMVEYKVYFEPYYHVLKALQCMPEVDFPMKNYLIDVNSNVEPPGYLTESSTVFTIHGRSVELFSDNWPTLNQFQLNATQYSAFQGALTEKFVVIQGPPGTGKTYLGLQIVKTLLHKDNIKYWYNETPILIVCANNHALDQFLQSLISTTKEIVRVGGRSKCEELDEFNLKTLRRCSDLHFSVLHNNKEIVMKRLLIHLKYYGEILNQIKKYNNILHFEHFTCIDPTIAHTWLFAASNSDLRIWLFQQDHYDIRLNTLNVLELPRIEERENGDGSMPSLPVLDSEYRMKTQIEYIETELQKMELDPTQQTAARHKLELEINLKNLRKNLEHFKMWMRYGETNPEILQPPVIDLHSMAVNDRWKLYLYWLNLYEQHVRKTLIGLQNEHKKINKQRTEIKNMMDSAIMKSKLVVGMTTSGAASLQTTLQTLKCPIVVVEEAAEVLESHITVSLTRHCQHLILIGDHQQLRPTTADYRIEKKFNLGISMFERMMRNNIQCHTLGVQHRMRPEIANLIVPHIYPQLENHHSVTCFPTILGMDSCLYFIHHEHQELDQIDTKTNLHEIQFLAKLARYLRQNGYKPEDITILTAYAGQCVAMREEVQKYKQLLEGVRICVLDNYQGEECKIILLSLVRNNREGKMGYLKTANRICVALSRARQGLYIMGNINLLCHNNQIWSKVKEVLVKQNSLGDYLSVRCRNHPDQVTKIKEPEDFANVAGGGCNRICGSLLKCGGKCLRTCHISDNDHTGLHVCTVRCSKICDNGHVCQKMSCEDCGDCTVEITRSLKCGHEQTFPCNVDPKIIKCKIPVPVQLPCGHTILNKPCFIEASNFKCIFQCNARIEPCGHACKFDCHINTDTEHLNQFQCSSLCEKKSLGCTTIEHICQRMCFEECLPCSILVERNLPNCGHIQYVECSADINAVKCSKPCKKPLPCGHECLKKCSRKCGACSELVMKKAYCGHEVKTKCSQPPNQRDCISACPKQLQCGHSCKKTCRDTCTSKCLELVDHTNKAACGHHFKIECHMLAEELSSNDTSLLKFCKEPCQQILECSHKCSGSCSECFQGRLHLVCSEQCEITLICGHKCGSLCSDVCEPCELKCSFNCGHTICDQKCGESCSSCNAPCSRKCNHGRCMAKCSQKCTVEPCQKSCATILKCGHRCVGFCGEPCIQLCRFCNWEALTEIFLGHEYDQEAKFVLLDECKHVIESKSLEMSFHYEDTENGVLVQCKRCPICKTPLASTQRYKDYIQKAKTDAIHIQMKDNGGCFNRNQKFTELRQKFRDIKNIFRGKISVSFLYLPLSNCYLNFACGEKSLNFVSSKIAETKFNIFESILEIFSAELSSADGSELETYLNYILKFLANGNAKCTNQVLFDFEREMCRLQRMRQFFEISHTDNAVSLSEIKEFIYRPTPYTIDFDKRVKEKLEELYTKLGKTMANMERRLILTHLTSKKHRWFSCRQGHYYKDFDDPTQIAKCDECSE